MFFEIHLFVHAPPDIVEPLHSDKRHDPPDIVESLHSDKRHAPPDIVEFIVSLHVFYGIPSLWLRSNRLFNVQFNSRCTLLHQTICHALADYVLSVFQGLRYNACFIFDSLAIW